ncbi:MAG: hypothetical protein C0504_19870 [Candidatus Solibacter sp.]|nr:hypothetical protein [Candidatus Solibacter sp.]
MPIVIQSDCYFPAVTVTGACNLNVIRLSLASTAGSPRVAITAPVPAAPPAPAPIAAPLPPPAIAPIAAPTPAPIPTFSASFLVDFGANRV